MIYEILKPGKLLRTDTVIQQSQKEGFFRFQSTLSTWQNLTALKSLLFSMSLKEIFFSLSLSSVL